MSFRDDKLPEERRVLHSLEAVIQALVDDNIRMSYQAELDWTEKVREAIVEFVREEPGGEKATNEKEENTHIKYQVIEKSDMTYLHYRTQATRPETVEATQFVADCIEQRANCVILDAGALPEAFISLRTGLAGEVLQNTV